MHSSTYPSSRSGDVSHASAVYHAAPAHHVAVEEPVVHKEEQRSELPAPIPVAIEEESAWSNADQAQCIQLDQEALEALDWPRLIDFFASLCRTALGEAYARELPFLASRQLIEREYAQVAEALWLLEERAERLPVGALGDLTPSFHRLAKGGSLEAKDMLSVGQSLESVAALRRFLHVYREEMPKLWERGELLEDLPKLKQAVAEAIDENGEIKDTASWELETLRQQVRTAHDRIRRKLQEYLASPRSKYLTDTYFTLREDRYVLPVKASEQGRFPGIVYGSSGSGATVYIEPQPLVNLNNALRMAENDVAQEEARILQRLSQIAMQHLPALRANVLLLRDLDLVHARVLLAERFEASIPRLIESDDPTEPYRLKQARHPLLILKEIDVVANDLQIGGKRRSLVFSGPNTGGKTVSLKTLGLCALMAQAALPIPAEPGSQVPLFSAIFTDVGDSQSIEHDLSTFSGQILKLQAMLHKADSQTLVLIDEIVVGTDPEQGSCLAAAILQELASRDAMVAVTTHYEYLKALAYEDERFENASVGFDLQKFEPTYRVYIGTPGASSALEIARRLGLNEKVCQRVEALMSDDTDRFESIVSRIEQQYQELYEERERATRARQRIERELLNLQKKQDELERTKQRLMHREEGAFFDDIRQARHTIRETLQELQAEDQPKNWTKLRKAERKVRDVSEQAKETFQSLRKAQQKERKPVRRSQLQLGQKVQVASLNTKAEILELPKDNNGDVFVRVGALRMRVPLSDLVLGGRGGEQAKAEPKRVAKGRAKKGGVPRQAKVRSSAAQRPQEQGRESVEEGKAQEDVAVQSRTNTCDMRGMRVEEALEKAEAFLDQGYREEQTALFLIHGHGTGALRKAIRQMCRSSNYVKRFRPGQEGEGGNGVTVVFLS